MVRLNHVNVTGPGATVRICCGTAKQSATDALKQANREMHAAIQTLNGMYLGVEPGGYIHS